MKTTRTNISDTRVKLTATLDAEELAAGEAVALTKLAKEIKAPGFRKGKVPPSVAKKHLDPQKLALEAADNAISKAVAEAFTSEDVRALERPQVEVTNFEPQKSLEFTAEADILPVVKLGNYKKLKAPKQDKVKVEQKEIDEVIERIRGQMATKNEVDRAAKLGDSVVLDFVGKKDDVPFDGGTANDYELVLGSGTFIPGFEEAVVGLKDGDTKSIDLNFPDDYHVNDLAGAKVVFDVTIKSVSEMVKPEVDDEFAAKVGPYTSAKELIDDIERELTTQAETTKADELKDALLEQLVEKSNVPVPQSLREDQLKSIEQDLTQNLAYRGQSFQQWLESEGHKDRDEWIEKEAGALAEKRVKTGLVLSELSKQEEITATDQEVAERLAAMKQQYANRPDMASQLESTDAQRSIANQILTEKTVDRLVELNTK